MGPPACAYGAGADGRGVARRVFERLLTTGEHDVDMGRRNVDGACPCDLDVHDHDLSDIAASDPDGNGVLLALEEHQL